MCVKNSVHRGGNTWAGTSPRQVQPPGQVHPPGRYSPRQVPPGRYTPWPGTPPRQVHPPGQVLPQAVTSPWAGTPRGRYPLPPARYSPQSVQCMLGDTGNKRALGILLECNLVRSAFVVTWGLPSPNSFPPK